MSSSLQRLNASRRGAAKVTPFDQLEHVIGPTQQRLTHLPLILRTVIDAGDSAAVTAVVVQTRLDDVRVDTDIGHAGRDRSADVVDAPRFHAVTETPVEVLLAVAPRGEAVAGAVAE